MSSVWRAVDEARQTSVAVKLVPLHLAPTSDVQTLERLVQVSAHPGLLTLLQHGCEGQWWYQIAEWVDGQTLESRCRTHAHSPDHAAELRVWMKQLASALQALHLAGFVHGDVKPSNVVLIAGQACLVDLVGLRIGASSNRHGGLTPAFASPEARVGAPADPRDDVYSLAAMIFQLLAGKMVDPVRASNTATLPPAGLTSFQWSVLQRALDPDRERRVGSPTALVDVIWPGSISPQRTPPPVSAHTARTIPALPVQPPRSRGRTLKYSWGIAATIAMGALALSLHWQTPTSPRVAATYPAEPIAEQAPQLSEAILDRVEDLPNSTTAAAAVVEPVRVRSSLVTVRAQPSRTRAAGTDTAQRSNPLSMSEATPSISPPATETSGVTGQEPSPEARAVSARVFVPDTPNRPDVPVVLGRPDVSIVPARFDVPVFPDRPEVPVVPERPDVPVVPELPDVPDIPEVPERPDVPAVPERPEVPAVPERPDRPERPDKPDKPERPDRPERPDKPDKPG